jgi:hypothetical protein
MDLTTLITACTLPVDPNVMHALSRAVSRGWQILKSMEDPVRASRDTQPNTVVMRVGLTGLPGTPRSFTAMFIHAPTSPRPHARSRSSSRCAEPPPFERRPEPLRHCGLARSGPITALPPWFWRPLPEAAHLISRCQAAQKRTPAKSALQGIPHHPTRRRRRLHPPRRTMTNAPARALSFRSWRSPPRVRRESFPQATGVAWRTEKRRSNGPSDSHSAAVR